MLSFLLIPDSFKGTMTSTEVCRIMERAIRSVLHEANVLALPVADGGEGSVEAFLCAVGGRRVTCSVRGPFDRSIEAQYGILSGGGTAVIETASCAGLPLVRENPDPLRTTTFGVGELILDACAKGCDKIILGLGGSCTNDGGTGMATALGVRFLDRAGLPFLPTGGTLKEIRAIDVSEIHPSLRHIEILAMCDVDNPLFGPEGAAFVYAPQKGAAPNAVMELDAGLRHLDAIVRADIGRKGADQPGAGAAGGLGYGASVFLDAVLRRGIEVVLDTVGFAEHLAAADYVFTGEGRLDEQSLRGKVIQGVARRTRPAGVPLIAFVGDSSLGYEAAKEAGVDAIVSINRVALPYEQMRLRAREDLSETVKNIVGLLARARSGT